MKIAIGMTKEEIVVALREYLLSRGVPIIAGKELRIEVKSYAGADWSTIKHDDPTNDIRVSMSLELDAWGSGGG
jgi:hypothetical protein